MTNKMLEVSSPQEETIDENERMIRLTQDYRERIIRSIAPEGTIPTDPNQLNLLLKTLDGASGTALSAKRIKSEEKTAQSNEALAVAIAQGASAILSSASPFPRGGSRDVIDVPVSQVPGHTYIGVQPVSADDILNDPRIGD